MSGDQFVIGLDIGTSTVRSIVYDVLGQVVGDNLTSARVGAGVYIPLDL